MKARVKKNDGTYSPWFEYQGDVTTAVLSTHYVPEDVVAPEFEVAFSNMDEVRVQRDRMIKDTDWTQSLDCPLSDEKKLEFVDYRNRLRNIPQTYSDPDDVVWPTKPEI
ncbi:TPA: tail fiber assembly protein [Vibrio mimicus]